MQCGVFQNQKSRLQNTVPYKVLPRFLWDLPDDYTHLWAHGFIFITKPNCLGELSYWCQYRGRSSCQQNQLLPALLEFTCQ